MSSEPPPKFNLGLDTVSQTVQSELPSPEDYDQKVGALVLQTLTSPQNLGPYNPVADFFDGRSNQLKALTGWGKPSLAMVLDPSNLPFMETAKQSKAKNHGVVRLGNVRVVV